MRKIYCDACGNEIKSEIKQFKVLTHIVQTSRGNLSGYAIRNFDNDGNRTFEPTSNREDVFDVCTKCYNLIHYEAFSKFKELRENNKLEDDE